MMTRPQVLALPRDDPRYIEHMRNLLGALPTRQVHTMHALHYLETRGGVHCLDFNLSGPNCASVDSQLEAEIVRIEWGHPGPAPDEVWMHYASLPQKTIYWLHLFSGYKHLVVSVHSEVGS